MILFAVTGLPNATLPPDALLAALLSDRRRSSSSLRQRLNSLRFLLNGRLNYTLLTCVPLRFA